MQAEGLVLALAAIGAIAASAYLLWINYTAYRKIQQLKTTS